MLNTEVGKRKELLTAFNTEFKALQELSQPIISKGNNGSTGEKERITARLAEVAKALVGIESVEQGKQLKAEQRDLADELTFIERIQENRKAGKIAEFTALAVPYFEAELKTYDALKALYIEVYNTTTPVTVASDLEEFKKLNIAKVGNVIQVKNILIAHGVLANGGNKFVDTKGGKVQIGNNLSIYPRELEPIYKAVTETLKIKVPLGGYTN